MATATFDTLKFVETLKEAGVPETQAKAFSTAVQGSHEVAELATKGGIADLHHEIGDLRKDMDVKLGQPEIRASQMAHRASRSAGWFINRPTEVFPSQFVI